MACESWKAKLDNYLDGELPDQEMRSFDAHVRNCGFCSSDALTRVQMKRAVHAAGRRFTPSSDFRRRMQRTMTAKSRPGFRLGWIAALTAALLVAGTLTSAYLTRRTNQDLVERGHVFSEIADLHVAALASSSPVDVLSTDRHTVKPWFQGKIPFAFNLPDLQSTDFSLLGGRMTYLDQTPGAHLIFDVRKHHISVFIFQERSVPSGLSGNPLPPKQLSFNVETWNQSGLRYFVIGDASLSDIQAVAKLLKTAS